MSELSTEQEAKLRPGDWVRAWGQVVERPAHPDDVVVEFFSHNEQWAGHVRRERVESASVPNFAEPCASLYEDRPGHLLRCSLHHNHAQAHTRGAQTWNNDGQYGYVDGDR